jgi:hypothetical protein
MNILITFRIWMNIKSYIKRWGIIDIPMNLKQEEMKSYIPPVGKPLKIKYDIPIIFNYDPIGHPLFG